MVQGGLLSHKPRHNENEQNADTENNGTHAAPLWLPIVSLLFAKSGTNCPSVHRKSEARRIEGPSEMPRQSIFEFAEILPKCATSSKANRLLHRLHPS